MIRHTLIYFLAYLTPGLLGFLSFGVYTHFMTPAEYAIYTVGLSTSFMIGSIIFGWLRFSISRFQAEMPERNFLPLALVLYAGIAAVAIPAIAIVFVTTGEVRAGVIAAVLAMTLAQPVYDITQEMRRGRHQSGAFARASIERSLIGFALSVATAIYFRDGAALLAATALGFFVVGARFMALHKQQLTWDFETSLWARFFRYGAPLTLSGIVFSGNSTLARVIVERILGAAAAGRYGAALDVTGQMAGMIASSVTSIIGPTAIRAYKTDGAEGSRRALARGAELFIGILMPATVGLAFVAKDFARFVSGPEFSAAVGDLLPVLIASRALNVFAQYYLHLGFQIIEKPLRQAICGVVVLAVNVGTSIVFTRAFGIMGAAYALLIADLAGILVSMALLHGVFPMPFPVRRLARVALATAIMSVACWVASALAGGPATLRMFVVVAAGVVSYGASVLALDIANVREAPMLQKALQSVRLRVAAGSKPQPRA